MVAYIGSKVMTDKVTSPLQKTHYASHPLRLIRNKINRLKRHIKRNAYLVAKKTKKGRFVKIDQQAINRLKALTK